MTPLLRCKGTLKRSSSKVTSTVSTRISVAFMAVALFCNCWSCTVVGRASAVGAFRRFRRQSEWSSRSPNTEFRSEAESYRCPKTVLTSEPAISAPGASANRAWWLAQVQKAPHERPQQLDWGNQSHATHGRLTSRAQRLRKSGLALLAGGLILLGFTLLAQLLL